MISFFERIGLNNITDIFQLLIFLFYFFIIVLFFVSFLIIKKEKANIKIKKYRIENPIKNSKTEFDEENPIKDSNLVFNKNNHVNKTIEEIDLKEELIKNIKIYYNEIDLLANAKTELDNPKYDFQQDIHQFIYYDRAVRDIMIYGYDFEKYPDYSYIPSIVDEDDIHGFIKNNNESKLIYFFGEDDYKYNNSRYDMGYIGCSVILGIVFETKYLNKRFFLNSKELLKNDNFREVYNYMEFVKRFDNNSLKKWSEKIINKYNGKKYVHDDSYEILNLSDSEKKILTRLANNNTDISFIFSVDNGVARVYIDLSKLIFSEDNFNENCKDITSIIIEILGEFTN